MQEPNSCGILIKQIHDSLEKQSNNALRDMDLTLSQIAALIALSGTPGKCASLKELERHLHIAQSTTAGIIGRLEQKGFVEGESDLADKRVKRVRLTPLGEACCIDAKQNITITEERLLSGLTEFERDIFQKLLEKVSKNIR